MRTNKIVRKMILHRETLRFLDSELLRKAAAGSDPTILNNTCRHTCPYTCRCM
jgi:hypothetical protein